MKLMLSSFLLAYAILAASPVAADFYIYRMWQIFYGPQDPFDPEIIEFNNEIGHYTEKERQRAEKAKKLADKQLKQQAAAAAAASKGPKTTSQTTTLPKYVDSTPEGSKKVLGSLDSPHHKAYIPAVVESAWDSWWTKQGFFEPQFTQDGDNMPAGSFVITIPPPNVTGALHCGHALGTALQDLLIRWQRMRGFTTLYLPGCDHASISTQTVVEKMLWKKEKRTRHDLGRDKFVQKALEWKNE
ncbi:Valine--tRNA ligase, mitochondrial [Diaporthe eres]